MFVRFNSHPLALMFIYVESGVQELVWKYVDVRRKYVLKSSESSSALLLLLGRRWRCRIQMSASFLKLAVLLSMHTDVLFYARWLPQSRLSWRIYRGRISRLLSQSTFRLWSVSVDGYPTVDLAGDYLRVAVGGYSRVDSVDGYPRVHFLIAVM